MKIFLRKSIYLLVFFSVITQELVIAQEADSVVEQNTDWTKNVDVSQFAEQPVDGELENLNDLRAIAGNIQSLKNDVIELNKDLRKMEEKLLFPSNTRYTVFLSLSFRAVFVPVVQEAPHLFNEELRSFSGRQ